MSARTGVAGRGLLVWWARPAVAVSFLYLVVVWAARPWKAGDTPFVLDGTDALAECLSRRDFVSRPMGVYALDGVGTTGGVVTSIAVAAVLLGCLVLLREGPTVPGVAAAGQRSWKQSQPPEADRLG